MTAQLGEYFIRASQVRVFAVVHHRGRTHWLKPGWYRRDGADLTPIAGWRLVLHRILWGYNRLVDAR